MGSVFIPGPGPGARAACTRRGLAAGIRCRTRRGLGLGRAGATRCWHQRRTRAVSSSGRPGTWSAFQAVADVGGVGGPVSGGSALPQATATVTWMPGIRARMATGRSVASRSSAAEAGLPGADVELAQSLGELVGADGLLAVSSGARSLRKHHKRAPTLTSTAAARGPASALSRPLSCPGCRASSRLPVRQLTCRPGRRGHQLVECSLAHLHLRGGRHEAGISQPTADPGPHLRLDELPVLGPRPMPGQQMTHSRVAPPPGNRSRYRIESCADAAPDAVHPASRQSIGPSHPMVR
jgi:hypothetical protein